ncbi:uncharacterized protein PADG_05887 [Paracoccidioides brasiliensis Pb18]|uniref:Uncharacterized protein n=1 Tax=Paracoccidioides brasiliensis (strain Pb18) TaxID=502780 RepID=C1GF51_PARBD|nr:uncharacterized protein PADG_05887 [Paracoccidioides brasiliensis Pb18]EEH49808.2 hypothetical protein PADG_05887 [Paracoccidioides brasiliensis Pb18]
MFRSADDAGDPLRQSHRLSGKPSLGGLRAGETPSTDQDPCSWELVVGLLGWLVHGPWHEEASVQLQASSRQLLWRNSWPKSQSLQVVASPLLANHILFMREIRNAGCWVGCD